MPERTESEKNRAEIDDDGKVAKAVGKRVRRLAMAILLLASMATAAGSLAGSGQSQSEFRQGKREGFGQRASALPAWKMEGKPFASTPSARKRSAKIPPHFIAPLRALNLAVPTPVVWGSGKLIPTALGLNGVNLHTWSGWGGVSRWNAFVANFEMRGKGTFYDLRLNDAIKFPATQRAGFAHARNNPDLFSPKLPMQRVFQLRPVSAPGKALFGGQVNCEVCLKLNGTRRPSRATLKFDLL